MNEIGIPTVLESSIVQIESSLLRYPNQLWNQARPLTSIIFCMEKK